MSDFPFPHWYAVYTHASHEWLADERLRKLGFFTFLPIERVRRRQRMANRGWVPKWVRVPYFPRYMFVAVRAGEALAPVYGAFGVADVVNCEGRPLLIRHRVIDELMAITTEDPEYDAARSGVRLVGTVDRTKRVRLEQGQVVGFAPTSAFRGIEAPVAIDDDKELALWLHMFGEIRKVTLSNPDAVEVLDGGPKAAE